MRKLLTILLLFISSFCYAAKINFSRPTYSSYLPQDSNTVFFLPFDDGFRDATGLNWTLTKDAYADVTTVSSGKYKKCLYDETGSSPDSWSLTPDSLSSFSEIGTGPFTLEFWFKPTRLIDDLYNASFLFVFNAAIATSSYQIYAISENNGTGEHWYVSAHYQSYGQAMLQQEWLSWVEQTWHHIAFVRNTGSGTCQLYFDGVFCADAANELYTADFSDVQSVSIGRPTAQNSLSEWLIDEVRLSNVARYTSSFTPAAIGQFIKNELVFKSSYAKLYFAEKVYKPASDIDLWLDAQDYSTLVFNATNSATIERWIDKSGNGYDATQTTESKQPTYNSSGLNNFAALHFDLNYRTTLLAPGSAVPAGNSSYTIFIVVSNTAQYQAFVSAGTSSENRGFGLGGPDDVTPNPFISFGWSYNAAYTPGGSWSYNTCHLVTSGWSGSTNNIIFANIDGVESASSTKTGKNWTANNVFIGSRFNSDRWTTGSIGELIIYKRYLTDAERISTEKYLLKKWGISDE